MKLIGFKRRAKTSQLPSAIDVGCAVIRQSGKLLITLRRQKDHLGGLWEFPGGKRLGSESLASCLEREIWEELAIRIRPMRFLKRIDYRYPDRWVSLYFYECQLVEGHPFPRKCQEARWVRPFELRRYAFPAADQGIIDYLIRLG